MERLKSAKAHNDQRPHLNRVIRWGFLVRQAGTERPYAGPVRDLDAIDRELRLQALLRAKTKESGGRHIDESDRPATRRAPGAGFATAWIEHMIE